MSKHSIFYYPYASFTNDQLPLLKAAALYFDKLYILDPVGASWNIIGVPSWPARNAVKALKEAGILETVSPSEVLAKFESQIADAIRSDLQTREFIDLCDSRGGGSWTLALAKVPEEIQKDQTMRQLMGDFARQAAWEAGNYSEHAGEYHEYAESGQAYDEYREGYEGTPVEYRYADFPLALGEAIMLNHALFGGLLHAGATPLTDDPFHNQVLALKIRTAMEIPAVRGALEDRSRQRQLKADMLGAATLTDTQLNLPILSPELSLEDILEYRGVS